MLCDLRVPSSSIRARPVSLGLLSFVAAVVDELLLVVPIAFAESTTVSSLVASVENSCDEQDAALL